MKCVFAKSVWHKLLAKKGLPSLSSDRQSVLHLGWEPLRKGCRLSRHHGYLAALVGAELLHLRRRSFSCRHDGGQDDARGTALAGKRNLLYGRYFGHLVIVFSLLSPCLFFFGVYYGLVSPF